MFLGEYQHTIDEKNRLALPVKFRQSFETGAVVTRGLDSCLFIFTPSEWEKLSSRLAQMPLSQAKSRAFARLMLAGAMEVSLDRQGRCVLPDYLKSYAQLEKQVVVTGLYNRLEIWDSALWQKYKLETEKDSTHIAESLSDLGI